MASKLVSAILWTLISVNVITLVLGGLITWLGYSIPVRLKQIGLLPELVIVAGFASLIVACVGLCGLNYSSHHTLNVYGFLCVVFTLMLVLGIPEVWYKSEQFVEGNLLINIVYFTLLFILLVLLLFAFTFSHHLRQEEQLALSPYQQQDTSCSLPNCTCNLNANDEPELGAGGSILDRWFPSANNKHNRLDSLNSPSRNNNNNLGCHLSDLRMPLYVNNLYNNDDCFDSSSSRVNMSNAAASSFSTANLNCNDRAAILNQCAPLIHKGFYKTDPPKSKTYTKTLNNQSGDSQQRQLKIISSGTNWTAPRVQRFASSQCIATKDDNSLQYGSLDSVLMPPDQPRLSQSATMNSRCRCNLEDFSKLQNNADSRVLAYRNKYPLANQLPPSTMPILNSRSSYALTRSGPKIRAKGSSSVMAVTAAAAAALFGEIPNVTSMSGTDEGVLYDGLFSGEGGADNCISHDAALMDNNRFDNNDQQLDVSMLNSTTESAFHHHHNNCH